MFWLSVMIVYSVWAFILPGPWSRTLNAVSASDATLQPTGLPELVFGFPEGMPARAFEKLGDAINDYAFFQLVDIPYAIIGAIMTVAGMALGLKRFNLGGTALRFALLLPVLYLVSEFVENSLLALMAFSFLPAEGAVAEVQQTATSLKFVADGFGSIALVLAVFASLIALLMKPLRSKKRQRARLHGE